MFLKFCRQPELLHCFLAVPFKEVVWDPVWGQVRAKLDPDLEELLIQENCRTSKL